MTNANTPKSRKSKVRGNTALAPAKNKEEIQTEKRKRARDIILTELIFVLIPFIFLIIISIEDSFTGLYKALIDLVLGPELALVSSLLYGQTCVKLISGLAQKNIPKWYLGTKKAAGFLALTMTCAFLYARISSANIHSNTYAVVQIILFVYAIVSFIVIGSIGQRLTEIAEKTDDA